LATVTATVFGGKLVGVVVGGWQATKSANINPMIGNVRFIARYARDYTLATEGCKREEDRTGLKDLCGLVN
jgi:hypothetical protein